MPSDLFKNTLTNLANKRAVVALSKTVPNTIINTKGVIYSAPGTPLANNFEPKSEAIPAATIPLGPTQLIKNSSFNSKLDADELRKTPKGLMRKTITANRPTVFQVRINSKSEILILAAKSMNNMDINKTLRDSLKYKSSFL